MYRLAFVLTLLLIAIGAVMRSVPINLQVEATVPKYCRTNTHPVTIDVPVSFRIDAFGNLIGTAATTIPDVACNEAALLTVQSLGHGARSSTALGAAIRYIATARFGSTIASVDTATTAKSGSTTGPQSGNIIVSASAIEPATSARVPGAVYVDMLRIELTPR